MKNDYGPTGDMPYQEWRNMVDVREDKDTDNAILSFRDQDTDLKTLVIRYYEELSRRGDRNLNREYLEFFNLKIDKQ
jgi:hypothetical protein